MTEKRESWITLAKAVALILVIFIHSTPRDVVSGFLTGFVMPAFFLLYGVSHNTKKCRGNVKAYLINRGRALMIPYFVLGFLMFLMYIATYPTVDLGFPPIDYVFWTIYGNGPLGRVTHLWFLRTMFFAIILFSLIDRYLHDKSRIFRYIIIAASPGIGVLFKFTTGVEIVPWGIDSVFIALSFMMIGSEIRRHNHLDPWSKGPIIDLVALVSAFAVYSVLSLTNSFVNIGESIYGTSIYSYMITGVLGTYIVSLLSYYACKRFVSLERYATNFNSLGQEIYETHPVIIELNVQVLGGLAIWETVVLYPGAPLLVLNFPLSILFAYFFASKVIARSEYLQIMFLGSRKPKETHPKLTFPVPVPNGDNGDHNVECIKEEEAEHVEEVPFVFDRSNP
ncbi:MAG: acyltransferase family protein [Candidatus Thorarchaeota archaeon]